MIFVDDQAAVKRKIIFGENKRKNKERTKELCLQTYKSIQTPIGLVERKN
jgi:hypothetical protein